AFVGFEVVFNAAHAPGPCSDGSPGIRCAILFSAAGARIDCANAVAETGQVVGIDVAVVEGGDSDAGLEKRLDVEATKAASGGGRDAGIRLGIPNGLRFDTGIVDCILHRAEVDAEKHRNRL